MDGRVVIAHGPEAGGIPGDLPYVPDFLLLRQGDRVWRASRYEEVDIGDAGLSHLVSSGHAAILAEPVPWEPGRWVVVDDSGLSFLPDGDEMAGRSALAKELVRRTGEIRGDPERSLSMLRAAGALIKVPLDRLVAGLESKRASPGESLVDIYQRCRKSQK